MLDMVSWEGQVYGIPFEYSPIVTMWNGLVLDKVGVDSPPKTWDEFLALGEALKSEGLYLGTFNFGFDYHAPSAITFAQPGAAEAMGKEQWDNQYVRFALERMKEIADNGYNLPNDLELDWRTSIPNWQNSQMAMYMNGAWTIKNEITQEGVDPAVGENVVFTPFVDCGFGSSIELKMTTAVGLGSHLADQPERLDAALKWLKYWSSEESAILFVTEAQSPMGVTIPQAKFDAAKAKVPMLAAFLGAIDQADNVFSHGLPSKIVRQRSWGMFAKASRDALLTGKSVDEAMQIFKEDMEST
jgi:ABC-type glycerol-3-phosphate transport system substrate-binding protein